MSNIKGYIISSKYENDRRANVELLLNLFPELIHQEAIYPQYQKIPFLNKLLSLSKKRTGHQLRLGELGCLLSHRKIWREIINSKFHKNKNFLIFESDSEIKDFDFIKNQFENIENKYDLFFWGAWEGYLKIYRSSKVKVENRSIGVPFIKSVYCTYGYSLNKKAAAYLLNKTKKINYPVDQFKRFISENELKIGAVIPEVISSNSKKSYIKEKSLNEISLKLFHFVLDVKNTIICYFK